MLYLFKTPRESDLNGGIGKGTKKAVFGLVVSELMSHMQVSGFCMHLYVLAQFRCACSGSSRDGPVLADFLALGFSLGPALGDMGPGMLAQ